jgi:hypothetical protein
MTKLPAVRPLTALLRRQGGSQPASSRLADPDLAPDVTPFVVSWFRFRHSRGGRRECACWICGGRP